MDKFDNPVKPNLVSVHNLLNETEQESGAAGAAPASAAPVSTPGVASPASTTDQQSPLYAATNAVSHPHDSAGSSPAAYHYQSATGNTVISPVSGQSPTGSSSECSHALPSPTSSQLGESHVSAGISSSSENSGMSTPPEQDSEELHCKWGDCSKVFNQPELLYHHLCQDHVGRKSQRNLQLNCQWDGCKTKTEKRDHITSHIRVHIPLKPFVCSSCKKKFKRPQDLKKHLKIHLDTGSIVKRKRGPKAGSKRISKNIQQGMMDQRMMMNDQRSRSLPLNAITGMPQIADGLRTFVTSDIQHFQPVFTHRLDAKLQNVMGQSANNMLSDPRARPGEMAVPSPSSVMDTLPPHVTAHAAGFFSDLSNNMVSAMPVYQNRAMPMQTTLHPILEKYPQLPPLKSSALPKPGMVYQPAMPMMDANANNNKTTMLPSLADGSVLQSRYNNNQATFTAGRPQIPGQGLEMWQRTPQAYPVISNGSMQQQQQAAAMGGSHVPMTYGIPSGVVYNHMQPSGSTMNMVENRFSTTQRGADRSTTEKDEEEDEDEEEVDFEDTLEFVNVVRDYLMCTLLEDEYEEADEEVDSGNLTKTLMGDLNKKTNDLISKYPKIMV